MAALVECHALCYTYRARTESALKDVTLALEHGSWTLVAGRSGGGKSTLLHAMAGLLNVADGAHRDGAVLIDGRDPQSLPAAERAALVGLVLQSADQQICTTTVEAEVAFGLENLALEASAIDARIDEALEFVGLRGERHRRVTELSGGQRQRLVLAAVLAMRPKVLLLDEPLSQLDPAASQQFLATLDRLRAGGPTLVVVEHRVAPWLERVVRTLLVDHCEIVERGIAGASMNDLENRHDAPAPPTSERSASRPSPRHPPLAIAQLTDISFTYDRHQPPTINQLCVKIHPNERIALLGANGSGKSTLLALLSGILQPQAGAITFAPSDLPVVALVPQNPDNLLFRRTVRDELAFAPLCAKCPPEEIAARVADAALRFHLEEHLDRASILLSQGERLRVALAATYTLHARLLVLDEPTTGQDPWHEAELMDALGDAVERGGPPEALLFSTHDLLVAERYADRALVLDGGRLVADDVPAKAIAAFRELLAGGAPR